MNSHSEFQVPTSGTSYRIVAPDPDWPKAARDEIQAIVAVLGVEPWRLEQVGSTAVPGLAAKPIIDLMFGVAGSPMSDPNARYLDSLRGIGYEHKGLETVPGTLYIRKANPRRFNLHMTEHGGPFWVDHLLFRDYLRGHPKTAGEYEALKRDLMAKHGHASSGPNRLAYTDAKSEFIASVLERARAETPAS